MYLHQSEFIPARSGNQNILDFVNVDGKTRAVDGPLMLGGCYGGFIINKLK